MSGSIGVIVSAVVIFIPATSWAGNDFNLGRVAFFEDVSIKSAVTKQEMAPLDWREPIIGTDGKVTYYAPPDRMLALLQEPTLENAKAYLDWQRQKDDRVLKAQAAIDALMKSEQLPQGGDHDLGLDNGLYDHSFDGVGQGVPGGDSARPGPAR